MIVQDNYATNAVHDGLVSVLSDETFPMPWFWLGSASGSDPVAVDGVTFVDQEFGFYHLAYHPEFGHSPIYEFVEPLILAIPDVFGVPVHDVFRVRLGMQTNVGQAGAHRPHTDLDEPHQTLLYYIGEADGDTLFYYDVPDGYVLADRNPHTANQAVLFDGLVPHSSSAPVTVPRRLTVNVNFR